MVCCVWWFIVFGVCCGRLTFRGDSLLSLLLFLLLLLLMLWLLLLLLIVLKAFEAFLGGGDGRG